MSAMTKAIAKAKAKNKKKVVAKKKKEISIGPHLDALESVTEERMAWVDLIMESCGEGVDEILESMVGSLHKMQGPPKLVVNGENVTAKMNTDEYHRLFEIQERNFKWISMRCLVACAEWGIKISNFKAPKTRCIRCGKKVKA